MISYEDECVCCPPEIGCLGSVCPNRNVPHYYCDECGMEFDKKELRVWYDKTHIFKECLLDKFKTLE